jgi:hypothetical protein
MARLPLSHSVVKFSLLLFCLLPWMGYRLQRSVENSL